MFGFRRAREGAPAVQAIRDRLDSISRRADLIAGAVHSRTVVAPSSQSGPDDQEPLQKAG